MIKDFETYEEVLNYVNAIAVEGPFEVIWRGCNAKILVFNNAFRPLRRGDVEIWGHLGSASLPPPEAFSA